MQVSQVVDAVGQISGQSAWSYSCGLDLCGEAYAFFAARSDLDGMDASLDVWLLHATRDSQGNDVIWGT